MAHLSLGRGGPIQHIPERLEFRKMLGNLAAVAVQVRARLPGTGRERARATDTPGAQP